MLAPAPPIRVLLVDDSGVSRALMTRWIDESGHAEVVASAADGASAVAILRTYPVDVVVLDVEMPHVDGLAAIPLLLAAQPGVRILMASSLTERGADATLEALRLGASDAIAKPRAGWAARGGASFRDELVERIQLLGTADKAEVLAAPLQSARSGLTYARSGGIRAVPDVVVAGASTGGPNALFQFIGALPADLPVPVLIAQHMPALFTAALARQLDERSALRVVEARAGGQLRPGLVYLAPGGCDLLLTGSPTDLRLVVEPGGEGGSHPSVDRLLASAVETCGARVLAILLSGMGQDGLEGASAVVDAGGAVLAQDRASSIVWGMPGSVVHAGLALEVLPPAQIAEAVTRAVAPEFAEIR